MYETNPYFTAQAEERSRLQEFAFMQAQAK